MAWPTYRKTLPQEDGKCSCCGWAPYHVHTFALEEVKKLSYKDGPLTPPKPGLAAAAGKVREKQLQCSPPLLWNLGRAGHTASDSTPEATNLSAWSILRPTWVT